MSIEKIDKQKLEELKKEREELEAKNQKIFERLAMVEGLINDKLLGATPWEVRIDDKGEVSLHNYAGKSFKKLTDLCYDGWGLKLRTTGAHFSEHDLDMYISFKSNDEVLPFIKRYGITLDLSKIKEYQKELEKGLKLLGQVLGKVLE